MRLRHVLLTLCLLLLLPLGAGARPAVQANPPALRLTADPAVLAPGQSAAVSLMNFNWSSSARLDVTLNAGNAAPVVLTEALVLGPRRRANLTAAPPAPGLWHARAEGQWIFGDATPATTTPLLVATAGSTTGPIALGQTVEGVVQPDLAWEDGAGLGGWYFDLAEPQVVTIQAQPQATANLELTLLGDAGQVYVEGAAIILNRDLPPGRVLIAVQSDTATAYRLTVSDGSGSDTEGGAIAPGSPRPGLLSPANDRDDFTFAAAPGDVVFAAAASVDGLDPFLELLDPAGNVVAANDDHDGLNPALSYVVPLPGSYTLRLSSNAGASAGSYMLDMAFDPEMTRLQPPTAIDIGQVTLGHVAPNGAQAWRFAASAGDVAGILAQSQSNGFDPNLTLYGPDGAQLAGNDDAGGNLNPLINATLPAGGFYTVVVGTYSGAGGDYQLSLLAEAITPTP